MELVSRPQPRGAGIGAQAESLGSRRAHADAATPTSRRNLCNLLAERYARRSVVVTSNPVFTQWDRMVDPLTQPNVIEYQIPRSVLDIVRELSGTVGRTAVEQRMSQSAARVGRPTRRLRPLRSGYC